MFKLSKIIPYVLIAVLSFVILYGMFIPKDIEKVTETLYDTLYEEVVIHDTTYIPELREVHIKGDKEIVEIMKYMDVDTSEILKQFFELNIYEDTLVNNKTLVLIVKDSVYMNKIIGRGLDYKQFDKVVIKNVTETIYDNSLKLYLGGSYNSLSRDIYVGGALTKGSWLLSLDYGISSGAFIAGVKYKISLRNKQVK